MEDDILNYVSDGLEDLEDPYGYMEAAASASVEDSFDGDEMMTEQQALQITDAIKSAATATYILLAQAHKHKAHKALGYDTWADYVSTEFDMSAQRSYQLLNLSKIVEELDAVTPEGTIIKLTEAQARDIKSQLPLITEEISARTAGKDPKESSDIIDDVISEIREQKKADEKAAAQKEAEDSDAEDLANVEALEAQADALLEADKQNTMTDTADGDYLEMTVEGSDDMVPPSVQMDLYNFMVALTSLSSLPEPEELIKYISESRAAEVEKQLEEAVAWLNRFQTLWEIREESE